MDTTVRGVSPMTRKERERVPHMGHEGPITRTARSSTRRLPEVRVNASSTPGLTDHRRLAHKVHDVQAVGSRVGSCALPGDQFVYPSPGPTIVMTTTSGARLRGRIRLQLYHQATLPVRGSRFLRFGRTSTPA